MFDLKNDEILICFLLIILGYCIAKMFSRRCEGFNVGIQTDECSPGIIYSITNCEPDGNCNNCIKKSSNYNKLLNYYNCTKEDITTYCNSSSSCWRDPDLLLKYPICQTNKNCDTPWEWDDENQKPIPYNGGWKGKYYNDSPILNNIENKLKNNYINTFKGCNSICGNLKGTDCDESDICFDGTCWTQNKQNNCLGLRLVNGCTKGKDCRKSCNDIDKMETENDIDNKLQCEGLKYYANTPSGNKLYRCLWGDDNKCHGMTNYESLCS